MKSPRMWMACTIALLALCLTSPIWSQCPAKTTISDTLLNADGTLASGRVVIAWPTYQAGGCQVIAGQATVTVNNGAFSVELYPNEGAVPSGTSYRATYYLKSGRITTEYWVVPASAAPVNLAAVRSSSVPVPAVMFSQSQVTNLLADLSRKVELPSPCPAGKFLQASGTANPPQVNCVDGTGAPLASSTQSGTVRTDVTETDPLVYTKATADSLLAGKAGASHTHAAADTTSGIFDPARLPSPSSSTLGGIKSGACSGTDKVTGVTATGTITCAADQSGGAGSQHQVNATNLAANDPVNFQDSATIAFANPSAGNVQASVKDGSVTAAKLAASNPTGAQLSGLSDANISAGGLSPNRISGTAEVQTNKNSANGYAGLDTGSRIAKAQAPSTVAYTDASNTWSAGTQDMSGASATLPVKAGTTPPGSCTANKELFLDTDATAGQQLFICNGAGNGWNLVGDGGGGSGGGQIFTTTVGPASATVAAGSTRYFIVNSGGGNGVSYTGTESSAQTTLPKAMACTDARVRTQSSQPAGGALTIVFRKNGADTALSFTYAASEAASTKSWSGSVSFTMNDKINWKITNGDGSSASAQIGELTVYCSF